MTMVRCAGIDVGKGAGVRGYPYVVLDYIILYYVVHTNDDDIYESAKGSACARGMRGEVGVFNERTIYIYITKHQQFKLNFYRYYLLLLLLKRIHGHLLSHFNV